MRQVFNIVPILSVKPKCNINHDCSTDKNNIRNLLQTVTKQLRYVLLIHNYKIEISITIS